MTKVKPKMQMDRIIFGVQLMFVFHLKAKLLKKVKSNMMAVNSIKTLSSKRKLKNLFYTDLTLPVLINFYKWEMDKLNKNIENYWTHLEISNLKKNYQKL